MMKIRFDIWIILQYLFICIYGSGYVEVRLKTYQNKNGTDQTGKCCDLTISGGCLPCDPYFEIYLSQNSSLKVNVSRIVTTSYFDDSNSILFGSNAGGVSNPFKLTFQKFTNTLMLVMVAIDDDSSDTANTGNDKLEELRFNVGQGEPSPFYTHPTFVAKVAKGNAVQIEFEYRISCDQYFYGNCDSYCKPKVGQYNCSTAGKRVCAPGWNGVQCDTGPCQSHNCKHNSTCIPNLSGGYNCSCLPSYSGKFCDTAVSPVGMSPNPNTSLNPNTIVTRTSPTVSSKSSTSQSESTSSNIGLIAGCSVAAAVLVAALLTLAICLYLKNSHDRKTNALPSKEANKNGI